MKSNGVTDGIIRRIPHPMRKKHNEEANETSVQIATVGEILSKPRINVGAKRSVSNNTLSLTMEAFTWTDV